MSGTMHKSVFAHCCLTGSNMCKSNQEHADTAEMSQHDAAQQSTAIKKFGAEIDSLIDRVDCCAASSACCAASNPCCSARNSCYVS